MMIHISPVLVCEADMIGNDSNLLIVFYVQIVPDDFVMQLHRFGERQGLPVSVKPLPPVAITND